MAAERLASDVLVQANMYVNGEANAENSKEQLAYFTDIFTKEGYSSSQVDVLAAIAVDTVAGVKTQERALPQLAGLTFNKEEKTASETPEAKQVRLAKLMGQIDTPFTQAAIDKKTEEVFAAKKPAIMSDERNFDEYNQQLVFTENGLYLDQGIFRSGDEEGYHPFENTVSKNLTIVKGEKGLEYFTTGKTGQIIHKGGIVGSRDVEVVNKDGKVVAVTSAKIWADDDSKISFNDYSFIEEFAAQGSGSFGVPLDSRRMKMEEGSTVKLTKLELSSSLGEKADSKIELKAGDSDLRWNADGTLSLKASNITVANVDAAKRVLGPMAGENVFIDNEKSGVFAWPLNLRVGEENKNPDNGEKERIELGLPSQKASGEREWFNKLDFVGGGVQVGIYKNKIDENTTQELPALLMRTGEKGQLVMNASPYQTGFKNVEFAPSLSGEFTNTEGGPVKAAERSESGEVTGLFKVFASSESRDGEVNKKGIKTVSTSKASMYMGGGPLSTLIIDSAGNARLSKGSEARFVNQMEGFLVKGNNTRLTDQDFQDESGIIGNLNSIQYTSQLLTGHKAFGEDGNPVRESTSTLVAMSGNGLITPAYSSSGEYEMNGTKGQAKVTIMDKETTRGFTLAGQRTINPGEEGYPALVKQLMVNVKATEQNPYIVDSFKVINSNEIKSNLPPAIEAAIKAEITSRVKRENAGKGKSAEEIDSLVLDAQILAISRASAINASIDPDKDWSKEKGGQLAFLRNELKKPFASVEDKVSGDESFAWITAKGNFDVIKGDDKHLALTGAIPVAAFGGRDAHGYVSFTTRATAMPFQAEKTEYSYKKGNGWVSDVGFDGKPLIDANSGKRYQTILKTGGVVWTETEGSVTEILKGSVGVKNGQLRVFGGTQGYSSYVYSKGNVKDPREQSLDLTFSMLGRFSGNKAYMDEITTAQSVYIQDVPEGQGFTRRAVRQGLHVDRSTPSDLSMKFVPTKTGFELVLPEGGERVTRTDGSKNVDLVYSGENQGKLKVLEGSHYTVLMPEIGFKKSDDAMITRSVAVLKEFEPGRYDGEGDFNGKLTYSSSRFLTGVNVEEADSVALLSTPLLTDNTKQAPKEGNKSKQRDETVVKLARNQDGTYSVLASGEVLGEFNKAAAKREDLPEKDIVVQQENAALNIKVKTVGDLVKGVKDSRLAFNIGNMGLLDFDFQAPRAVLFANTKENMATQTPKNPIEKKVKLIGETSTDYVMQIYGGTDNFMKKGETTPSTGIIRTDDGQEKFFGTDRSIAKVNGKNWGMMEIAAKGENYKIRGLIQAYMKASPEQKLEIAAEAKKKGIILNEDSKLVESQGIVRVNIPKNNPIEYSGTFTFDVNGALTPFAVQLEKKEFGNFKMDARMTRSQMIASCHGGGQNYNRPVPKWNKIDTTGKLKAISKIDPSLANISGGNLGSTGKLTAEETQMIMAFLAESEAIDPSYYTWGKVKGKSSTRQDLVNNQWVSNIVRSDVVVTQKDFVWNSFTDEDGNSRQYAFKIDGWDFEEGTRAIQDDNDGRGNVDHFRGRRWGIIVSEGDVGIPFSASDISTLLANGAYARGDYSEEKQNNSGPGASERSQTVLLKRNAVNGEVSSKVEEGKVLISTGSKDDQYSFLLLNSEEYTGLGNLRFVSTLGNEGTKVEAAEKNDVSRVAALWRMMTVKLGTDIQANDNAVVFFDSKNLLGQPVKSKLADNAQNTGKQAVDVYNNSIQTLNGKKQEAVTSIQFDKDGNPVLYVMTKDAWDKEGIAPASQVVRGDGTVALTKRHSILAKLWRDNNIFVQRMQLDSEGKVNYNAPIEFREFDPSDFAFNIKQKIPHQNRSAFWESVGALITPDAPTEVDKSDAQLPDKIKMYRYRGQGAFQLASNDTAVWLNNNDGTGGGKIGWVDGNSNKKLLAYMINGGSDGTGAKYKGLEPFYKQTVVANEMAFREGVMETVFWTWTAVDVVLAVGGLFTAGTTTVAAVGSEATKQTAQQGLKWGTRTAMRAAALAANAAAKLT